MSLYYWHIILSTISQFFLYNPSSELFQDWTVQYYLKLGASPLKLVIGVPAYGRTFRLADPSFSDFGSLATGGARPGNYTKEEGFLAFYEVRLSYKKYIGFINDLMFIQEFSFKRCLVFYQASSWQKSRSSTLLVRVYRYELRGCFLWVVFHLRLVKKCRGTQRQVFYTNGPANQSSARLLMCATQSRKKDNWTRWCVWGCSLPQAHFDGFGFDLTTILWQSRKNFNTKTFCFVSRLLYSGSLVELGDNLAATVFIRDGSLMRLAWKRVRVEQNNMIWWSVNQKSVLFDLVSHIITWAVGSFAKVR